MPSERDKASEHDEKLFKQWRMRQITTEQALAEAKYPERLAKRIANQLRDWQKLTGNQ